MLTISRWILCFVSVTCYELSANSLKEQGVLNESGSSEKKSVKEVLNEENLGNILNPKNVDRKKTGNHDAPNHVPLIDLVYNQLRRGSISNTKHDLGRRRLLVHPETDTTTVDEGISQLFVRDNTPGSRSHRTVKRYNVPVQSAFKNQDGIEIPREEYPYTSDGQPILRRGGSNQVLGDVPRDSTTYISRPFYYDGQGQGNPLEELFRNAQKSGTPVREETIQRVPLATWRTTTENKQNPGMYIEETNRITDPVRKEWTEESYQTTDPARKKEESYSVGSPSVYTETTETTSTSPGSSGHKKSSSPFSYTEIDEDETTSISPGSSSSGRKKSSGGSSTSSSKWTKISGATTGSSTPPKGKLRMIQRKRTMVVDYGHKSHRAGYTSSRATRKSSAKRSSKRSAKSSAKSRGHIKKGKASPSRSPKRSPSVSRSRSSSYHSSSHHSSRRP